MRFITRQLPVLGGLVAVAAACETLQVSSPPLIERVAHCQASFQSDHSSDWVPHAVVVDKGSAPSTQALTPRSDFTAYIDREVQTLYWGFSNTLSLGTTASSIELAFPVTIVAGSVDLSRIEIVYLLYTRTAGGMRTVHTGTIEGIPLDMPRYTLSVDRGELGLLGEELVVLAAVLYRTDFKAPASATVRGDWSYVIGGDAGAHSGSIGDAAISMVCGR